jgi:hypothetical protein
VDKFAIAWIVWIGWFAVWETWAIIDGANGRPGGTLSEHVRELVQGRSLLAFLLVAFCLWLAWHIVFEEA